MKMKVQLLICIVTIVATAAASQNYATAQSKRVLIKAYVTAGGKNDTTTMSSGNHAMEREKTERPLNQSLMRLSEATKHNTSYRLPLERYDVPIVRKNKTLNSRVDNSSKTNGYINHSTSQELIKHSSARSSSTIMPPILADRDHDQQKPIKTYFKEQIQLNPLNDSSSKTAGAPLGLKNNENFNFSLFPINFPNIADQRHSNELPTVLSKKLPKKVRLSTTIITTTPKSVKPKRLHRQNVHKSTTKYDNPITQPAVSNSIRSTSTEGPFHIALPTLTIIGSTSKKEEKRAVSVLNLRERYNCPIENEVRFQLFPKICKEDKDCNVWNRDELCCEIFGAKSCVSGIPKPLEEASHAPIFGLIPRKCPTRPLAELWWDVQECNTDMDCWPRVCCPDGRHRYCRTSQPELEAAPLPVRRSFDYFTEYFECTPPPPQIFDLHPKVCTSTLDCFPNVCCQEAGLRHCRPPKKSVLTLMTNFLNVDFVKRIAQNIVIK